MGRPLHVLVVEDSETDTELELRALKRGGFDPILKRVEDEDSMLSALKQEPWDVVIADYALPNFNGLQALKLVKESGLDLPIIVVSGKIGEDTAVEFMRAGAQDYIMKSNLKRLAPAVERELLERQKRIAAKAALIQAEQRTARLNSVLNTFRQVGQIIVHEKNTQNLIQKATDILGASSHYRLAWILLVDENKKFKSVAFAGPGKDVISNLTERFKQGDYLQCARTLFSQESKFIKCEDVEKLHADCPLVDYHFGGAGFSSRLEYEGKIYGSISIDVPRPVILDIEEQHLFRELADDISFALANIEKEETLVQSEKEMRQSEQRYRDLCNLLPETICETDMFGNVTFANNHAFSMFGYSHGDLAAGLNILQMISVDQMDNARMKIQSVLNGEYMSGVEYTIRMKDGTRFPVLIYANSIVQDGKPAGLRMLIIDITERKKMEEQLIAQDRLASIGQLASGIAHEINNPLTSVIGFSELLLTKDEIKNKNREDLEIISNEAQRTARVVKGLLTFARKQKVEKVPLDVNKVITGVLELRHYEQKVNNIEVINRLSPDLPLIVGNGAQLGQVFMNVVVNAEQAMLDDKGKGTLVVSSIFDGDIVRVSFTDDGPGISTENMKRIFTPFFTTKEIGKGTGLGLSISYGIVSEHSGKMYAQSEFGKGATFIIELPVGGGAAGPTGL